MIDVTGRDLVGCEQQRRDREASGVGARALIAAQRVGVRLVRRPTPRGSRRRTCGGDVRAPHLVELLGPVWYTMQVAVAVAGARVAGLAFDVAAGRNGHRDVIAVRREEVAGRRERSHRRGVVAVSTSIAKSICITLPLPQPPSALERRDHRVAVRAFGSAATSRLKNIGVVKYGPASASTAVASLDASGDGGAESSAIAPASCL